ncbi:MAG: hypothetical protein IH989_03815 [Planctomycetes bacterium]|nr:hypothetical protein [Planctomycetota bacterium]
MIARFAGAGLGLLAFAVTTISGLIAQVPADVTLSRSILALLLFCVIGLLLGGVAQRVIDEHRKGEESRIRARFEESNAGTDGGVAESDSDETPVESAAG